MAGSRTIPGRCTGGTIANLFSGPHAGFGRTPLLRVYIVLPLFIKFRLPASDAQLDTVNKSSNLYLQIVRLFNKKCKVNTSFSITVISPTLSTSLSRLSTSSLFPLYFPLSTSLSLLTYPLPHSSLSTSSLLKRTQYAPKHAPKHAPNHELPLVSTHAQHAPNHAPKSQHHSHHLPYLINNSLSISKHIFSLSPFLPRLLLSHLPSTFSTSHCPFLVILLSAREYTSIGWFCGHYNLLLSI